MTKKGTCALGLYWAINVNGDAKYIFEKAYAININTDSIVKVYNSTECDLSKIISSQRIKNCPKCNILVIAPENFAEIVDSVIGC